MKRRALVFPGQGSQRPYMGQSFYEMYSEAREVYEEAEDLLSMHLRKTIFSSDEVALVETDFCQVALFVTSMAILKVIESQTDLTFGICAGLSLGEYSALGATKKIGFSELLKIVQLRGQFMHKATQEIPQGMSAVLGLNEDQIPTKYQVANLNCRGQVVIAGSLKEMKEASKELKKIGARRVVPLKVKGAFHTSYMTKARDELKPFVDDLNFNESSKLFVMNVTGQVCVSDEEMKVNLVEQVHKKTRWLDCMKTMTEMGAEFIEVGPKQLSSLNKKMDGVNSFVTIENVSDLEQLYEKV